MPLLLLRRYAALLLRRYAAFCHAARCFQLRRHVTRTAATIFFYAD